MLPDKKLWRFANLNPDPDGWDDIIADICESLKSSQPIPPDIVDWKQWTRSNPSYFPVAEFMHAYGFSLDLICAVLRASVQIELNCLRAQKSISAIEGISRAGYCYVPMGIALLIDDFGLLQACQREVKDLPASALSGIDATLRMRYEFSSGYLETGNVSMMQGLTSELNRRCPYEFKQYDLMFSDNEVAFSDYVLQDAIQFMKNPAQRSRKRKAAPGELVSIGALPTIAYALHRGLCFSGYDPSLPIWDFPIAQRPEIQALLSKEIVERIPSPSTEGGTRP